MLCQTGLMQKLPRCQGHANNAHAAFRHVRRICLWRSNEGQLAIKEEEVRAHNGKKREREVSSSSCFCGSGNNAADSGSEDARCAVDASVTVLRPPDGSPRPAVLMLLLVPLGRACPVQCSIHPTFHSEEASSEKNHP